MTRLGPGLHDGRITDVRRSGSNDLVDSAPCKGSSCDLTPDIGISGIYFSFDSGAPWTQPAYTGLTAQTGTVLVSDTTLAVEFGDGDTRVIRRTTTLPVRSIKGQRPQTFTLMSETKRFEEAARRRLELKRTG